jgi:predicted dehydrogenase
MSTERSPTNGSLIRLVRLFTLGSVGAITAASVIGIGLVGVGRHGIRYARHIVQDVPAARLVAVCRRHPEQGVGVPGTESVRMHGDPASLIEDPSVDVVIAVMPPLFSRGICLEAVRAGKPVLIEKPLATAADDARVMAEQADAAGVPLMTAQTLRFDATIEAMKATRGLLGRSRRLQLTSHIETKDRGPHHADGYGKRGALLEVGVHLLDLVRFLTGEDIRAVHCTTDAVPPAAPETIASVQLVTDRGTECAIDVRRVESGRVGTAVWTGSDGELAADWITRQLHWTGRDATSERWTFTPSPTVLATVASFLDAVRHHRPMPITGWDGFRAVEAAEACYRSAQAGGAAVTLPLKDGTIP